MRRARTLVLGGVAAVLLSMAIASAAVLSVSGGTLAVFTIPATGVAAVEACGHGKGPKFPPPKGHAPSRDDECCPQRDDRGRPWDGRSAGALGTYDSTGTRFASVMASPTPGPSRSGVVGDLLTIIVPSRGTADGGPGGGDDSNCRRGDREPPGKGGASYGDRVAGPAPTPAATPRAPRFGGGFFHK